MSSSEEDDFPHLSSSIPKKKRRLPRACDACRRKKTKCDSALMPGSVCSNCISLGAECMHTIPKKKRGRQKEQIKVLEERLNDMALLFAKLHPDKDLNSELSAIRDSASQSPPFSDGTSESIPPPPGDSEYNQNLREVARRMSDMNISSTKDRYFGNASNFSLAIKAMGVKEANVGSSRMQRMHNGTFRRLKYWDTPSQWQQYLRPDPKPPYQFPPDDLMQSLISLYFAKTNIFYPILHLPTFQNQTDQQLHYRDSEFGGLLLLICSVAARHSNDPRVLLPESQDWLSSGFAFFRQVQLFDWKSAMSTISLHQLQSICVACLYLTGLTVPIASWNLIGYAVRACIERGIHQHLPSGGRSSKTFEDELWKRGFLFIISLDRQISLYLGRPSALASEEIEIDLPEECDDEYWASDGFNATFHQAPAKPSLVACFNTHLKLSEIYAVSHRTLYGSSGTRALFGLVGDSWEAKIVTELDSKLNRWLDSVPSHLRWNPQKENKTHFDQSCLLYVQYYFIQIQIHRPFIDRRSSLAFPSLAICTNSARSCSHVLDAQLKRGNLCAPYAQMSAYASGLVLVMNIFGAERASIKSYPEREIQAINTCLRFLSDCEVRWYSAGRFWDIINELSSSLNITTGQKESVDEPQATAKTYPTTSGHEALPSSSLDVSTLHHPSSLYSTTLLPEVEPMSIDWNMNPYAFPSTSYPLPEAFTDSTLFLDPAMSINPGLYGIHDLERISQQILSDTWPSATGADY